MSRLSFNYVKIWDFACAFFRKYQMKKNNLDYGYFNMFYELAAIDIFTMPLPLLLASLIA